MPASLNFFSTAAMYTYETNISTRQGIREDLMALIYCEVKEKQRWRGWYTYLIGKISVTRHSLAVLVLGLIENDRTSFSDLSLCNDLANGTGIVVGCVEETGIPRARNTWVPTKPSREPTARNFSINVGSRSLNSGQQGYMSTDT
jgi:hypothetical protein